MAVRKSSESHSPNAGFRGARIPDWPEDDVTSAVPDELSPGLLLL